MTFATPLKFYEDECNVTAKKSYCSDSLDTYDYFMPLGIITPFLIESSSLSISTIYLKSAKTGYVANVTAFFDIHSVGYGLYFQDNATYSTSTSVNVRASILTVGGYNEPISDFIRKNGNVYYLVITDGFNPILYSDIFGILNIGLEGDCIQCSPYFSISWLSDCNVGDLRYKDIPELNNKVYLSTALSKPEYQYEEEGNNDGRGEFFAKFQSIKKIRKAEIFGNESLADALAMIPLHSQIHITDNDGNTFSAGRFLTDVNWQNDCLATISISIYTAFTTKNNCCN